MYVARVHGPCARMIYGVFQIKTLSLILCHCREFKNGWERRREDVLPCHATVEKSIIITFLFVTSSGFQQKKVLD